MDRNSIIGIVLIGFILIGYQYFNRPSAEEIAKHKAQMRSDSVATAMVEQDHKSKQNQVIAADTLQKDIPDSIRAKNNVSMYGSFASSLEGKPEFFTLENRLVKISLSTLGGRISSVQLKKYKSYNGGPLNLFSGDSSNMSLNFFSQNRAIQTGMLYFKPLDISSSNPGKGPKSFAMRLYADEKSYIEYLYTLKDSSYMLDFKINTVGMHNSVAANTSSMDLNWEMNIPLHEQSINSERDKTTIYYKYSEDEVDYIGETSYEKKALENKVKWVAFKQQYFTSVLIAENSFEKPVNIETIELKDNPEQVKKLKASLAIPYNHKAEESFAMSLYFGPNHYQTLKSFDLGLEKQVPLGWGIFGWVNRFLVIPTFNLLSKTNMSYGIIILILTIIIKIVLLPLTYKAYLSQAKMKVLKPEIDEINAKKGNDPMKTQQETMALYKKAGVNPLGGCLPMLLQLPILIAMFNFFPASIELRQESFLWAKDLSTYDSIWNFGFRIPGYGDHVSLFTLLMTISTLIYTRMTNQFTSANTQMKWMSYLMPVIFLGVFNDYPAALSYYYFLANITSFGQQYLFKFFVDEDEIHRKIQENKKKPVSTKKSGFQKRLEEVAKAKGYNLKK
jgi:YidC/Oxa1 family membrane protein insertase